MIAAISPADYNTEETLGTLRYASRAKAIKNKPRVNQDPKDALLKQYEDEISRLKAMLEKNQGKGGDNQQNIDRVLSLQREGSVGDINNKQKRRDTETVEDLLKKLHQKGQDVAVVNKNELQKQSKEKQQTEEEINQMQQLMQEMEAQLVSGG